MARVKKTIVNTVKEATDNVVNKVAEVVDVFPRTVKLKDKIACIGTHMVYLKGKNIQFIDGKATVFNKETYDELKQLGVI